ncbi:MAG: (2Fe-2S)-binding protein [Candidatus Tectomicrobia bacterium]|uniref:(2Fe-2S)-binding protein n=1 Tax=Tectimicrobiota bacterium TaxID=2528274 RepID=A0A932ZV13_UNCTE|nr:(2Fe-2S)-binding protein [Candidatus Tectomicrobia bacterium]MBI2131590.1 (2Fe-2S)-binding protein [Candidatus Tectomicrobia bacterium]MBI4251090.1 (2Fe-2S)-binding protein [Candidatus Tectomicrobia bacterium]
MATVRIENLGVTLEGEPGWNLLECSLLREVDHPHDCGGNCACSTCKVVVVAGGGNLSPQAEDERDTLDAYGWDPGDYRLACQCVIQGEGEIVIRLPE